MLFENGRELDQLPSPFREFARKVGRLIVHAAIAGVGCMFVGFLLLSFLQIKARGPHYFVILFFTDVPYSPAFWGSAFVVGFFLNRYFKDNLAYWSGPIAVLALALMILIDLAEYEHNSYEIAASNHSFIRYEWGQLFSLDPNKCPADECLGKLLFTAPVLNSIAYSVGARLAVVGAKRNH